MTNRTQLEQQAGKMQVELDKLYEQIKQLPEENERWKPENGEEYYYLSVRGVACLTHWDGYTTDTDVYAIGNCFKTEEEAELHKLRLESMANRWKPELGDQAFYWRFGDAVGVAIWGVSHCDADYLIGNMHPTAEAAQAWYDRFGRSWEALLK